MSDSLQIINEDGRNITIEPTHSERFAFAVDTTSPEAKWQHLPSGQSLIFQNRSYIGGPSADYPGTSQPIAWCQWLHPKKSRLVPIDQGLEDAPYGLRAWISTNLSIPFALEALAYIELGRKDTDNSILVRIAANEASSEDVLDKLAETNDSKIFAVLANNPSASTEALVKMKKFLVEQSRNSNIELAIDLALAKSRRLTEALGLELASHTDAGVRMALAENRYVPDEAIKKLLKDRSPKVRKAATRLYESWCLITRESLRKNDRGKT